MPKIPIPPTRIWSITTYNILYLMALLGHFTTIDSISYHSTNGSSGSEPPPIAAVLISHTTNSPLTLSDSDELETTTSTKANSSYRYSTHLSANNAEIGEKSSHCPSRRNLFFIFSEDKNSSFDSLPVKCAIKSACLMNPDLNVYIVCKHYPSHLL